MTFLCTASGDALGMITVVSIALSNWLVHGRRELASTRAGSCESQLET